MSLVENICFLLLRDKPHLGRGSLLKLKDSRTFSSKVKDGELLSLVHCTMHIDSPIELPYCSEALHIITSTDFLLLLPITPIEKRIDIYFNDGWMSEGRTMTIDDDVYIFKLCDAINVPGTIKYVGNLYEVRATFFGIELDKKYAGLGSSNGFFRGQRFRCGKDCGVFRNLSEIRKNKRIATLKTTGKNVETQPVSQIKFAANTSVEGHVPSTTLTPIDKSHLLETIPNPKQREYEKVICEQTKEELVIGEKVVHLTDTSAEFAVLKWIGKLPGKMETYAGLEFDNPIGEGTGKYKGFQYFHANKDHAKFIPLMGLMRARDYGIIPQLSVSKPPRRSSDLKGIFEKGSVIQWRDEQWKTYCEIRPTSDEQILCKGHASESSSEESFISEAGQVWCVAFVMDLILKCKDLPELMSSASTNRDTLRGVLIDFVKSINVSFGNEENLADLKNILDLEALNPKLSGVEPVVEYSLKLFTTAFGSGAVKYAVVRPSSKYEYLNSVLENSENNDFFGSHFRETFIYLVALNDTSKRNNIIPSLTLDFDSVFFSCRRCKQRLKCSDCFDAETFSSLVCLTCLDDFKSLRLSTFCEDCFEPFHQQHGMASGDKHSSSSLNSYFSYEKNPDPSLFKHSRQGKDLSSLKMKLFAFVSLVGKTLRLHYKSEEDDSWYVRDHYGESKCIHLVGFIRDYMTCPSSLYDSEYQRMLDGVQICYYRRCELP